MQTPIYDFLTEYQRNKMTRMHMPGHKGAGPLGLEALDITEVKGADSLYEADGIIFESEANATSLFGSGQTFFSTEGSSQCIRAMLYLAVTNHSGANRRKVVAARNVHKAFIYAASLLDLEVTWLQTSKATSLCQCNVTAKDVEEALQNQAPPACVYLTSPNYLGEFLDIEEIAKVCHKYDTLLVVDNAHGAYTHFLPKSMHPLDLGADLVCDSAHKTLPVLTGGAYLHIHRRLPEAFTQQGKQALALFGSTSPSYLILASLDCCNAYLSDSYEKKLRDCIKALDSCKQKLQENGWEVIESDPLKLTIRTPLGVSGIALADKLRKERIECEYAEEAYIVFMLTPSNTSEELEQLVRALGTNSDTSKRVENTYTLATNQLYSIREAVFAPHELISVKNALGRVCGSPTVSCPPAIPIAVSGEEITAKAIEIFQKYNITEIDVVK